MQAMILARDEKTRRKALAKLLPMQRNDFAGLFSAMDGFPVVIRTLDPPLHEFLPKREDLMVEIAKLPYADIKAKKEMVGALQALRRRSQNLKTRLPELLKRVEELHEFNPMLGHRGCRLGITYPEITEMQARAIFEAAVQVAKKGVKVIPEVMIPLIGGVKELREPEGDRRARRRGSSRQGRHEGPEVPGRHHDRDPARRADRRRGRQGSRVLQLRHQRPDPDHHGPLARRLHEVLEATTRDLKIFKADPFAVLDQEGVGKLVEMAVKPAARPPDLEVGICGEHGGEPSSVEFCYRVGMDYVSCSPYRVPIARLAAAQAAISGDKSEAARTA